MLAGVYENSGGMHLKIYELDPAHFLSAAALAFQAAFKNTKVKIDLLTGPDMLLMIKAGITGGICHSIYEYAKGTNKYIKEYDKNKKLSYLWYWDANSSYGWAPSQIVPMKNFKWDKYISEFDERFVKS